MSKFTHSGFLPLDETSEKNTIGRKMLGTDCCVLVFIILRRQIETLQAPMLTQQQQNCEFALLLISSSFQVQTYERKSTLF